MLFQAKNFPLIDALNGIKGKNRLKKKKYEKKTYRKRNTW